MKLTRTDSARKFLRSWAFIVKCLCILVRRRVIVDDLGITRWAWNRSGLELYVAVCSLDVPLLSARLRRGLPAGTQV
jgi:hypothetical protein